MLENLGQIGTKEFLPNLSLANCYFTHDSSVFPFLLRFAMRNPLVLLIHLYLEMGVGQQVAVMEP